MMMSKKKKKAVGRQQLISPNAPINCVCGNIDVPKTFTWASLNDKLVFLCWDCTDTLHRRTIEKSNKDNLEEVIRISNFSDTEKK